MISSIEERLNSIKQLKQSHKTAYKYSQEQKQWVPFVETFANEPTSKEEIVTVSHNVLTDRFGSKPYKTHVLHAEERYSSILKETCEMQPDVVSFNEVSVTFYNMVKECDWVKKDYWVSNFQFGQGKDFGNILITKLKPICFETINIHLMKRTVETAFFHLKNKKDQDIILSFSSIHLTAIYTNVAIRVEELTDLKNQLSRFDKVVDDQILQGDMNFHSQAENEILPTLNLKDAWLQLYSIEENPGYTLDTLYNQMTCQMSWGFRSSARMRLDRIFYSNNVFEVKEMKVIFDTPIYGDGEQKKSEKKGYLKGGLSFISDTIFGRNLFREKEKYLFKSDHFGLRACLKLK